MGFGRSVRRRWSGIAGVLALVALGAFGPVGLSGAEPAAAQTAPPVGGAGEYVESWAVTPGTDEPGRVSSRSSFSYRVAPGATLTDSVTVWNYSPVAVQFRVFSADAFNATDGTFTVGPTDEPPKDVGRWVRVGSSVVTVPARSSATLPVEVVVPRDASPGDHAGAILVTTTAVGRSRGGTSVDIERRSGARFYLRVDGSVSPALVADDVRSTYRGELDPFGGSLEVEWTVRNPGNVRLRADQRLVVRDAIGRTIVNRRAPRVENLLPGNSATFRETVRGVPATVRVKAVVEIEPRSAPGAEDEAVPSAFSVATTTWALPQILLPLVALAYLVGRLVRRARGRRRSDRSPSGTPERTPEPAGV
jgi:hypothetical protein